jgi:hypothetical protein
MPAQHPSPKPSKTRCYSQLVDSEIMRILTLGHSGLSTRAIARQVTHSPDNVFRILQTYDYKNFVACDRTRISKRKTTEHEDRILTRTAKTHNDQAYRDIIYMSGIKVSCHALRRRLKEINLYSRICRKKPVLKPHHKAAHLRWAKKYEHWTV